MEANFTKIKVGDYMLKDGTTVNPIEMTEEQEDQAIGVVAYLYEEHKDVFLKGGVKAALKAKGIENPHGIVIALGNAGGEEKYEWSTEEYPSVKKHTTLNEQIFFGLDGVGKTYSLKNIDDFPAFRAAKEYEKEVPAPKNTTGWYLPSVGEWFCMLDNYKDFAEHIGGTWEKYWTSSECDIVYAYSVDFYSRKFIFCDDLIDVTNYVRPILAF